MTLAVQTVRQLYNGNGSTVDFAIPFAFSANDQVEVTLISSAGVETLQAITTHYTIAGSTVTMLTAPAAGAFLLIKMDKDFNQILADFSDQAPFLPTTAEAALDYLASLTQQLKEEMGRAIKMAKSSTHTNVDVFRTLTAGAILAVDDAGTGIEMGPTLAAFEADVEAASDDADAAATSAASASSSASAASASATAAAASETAAAASAAAAAAAALSDGDKGDITVSASGATWTIDNDAVTYAKIQDVSATDMLLGRSTAGAGVIEEIPCTAAGRAILDDANAAAQRATLGSTTVGDAVFVAATAAAAQQAMDVEVGVDVQAFDAQLSSLIRQNSQSAAYTTVLTDGGKHILHPAADNNARTFTIDSNANVAYPIGTAITFINEINTVTISITSDTMTLAGTGSTGNRTLAANGVATAIKTGTTSWWISGTGLT